jgi:predicted PurR-regulated permease PerM
MASAEPDRLRVTNRSVVVAVLLVGIAIIAMRVFLASTRVLGWLAVAGISAGLLYPIVTRVSRRVPRGVAVAAVFISALALLGLLVYSGIDDVRRQSDALQREAPEAAEELEDSARFGDVARQFHLVQRTEDFVDDLPERLRGGDAASALRSAATRGVAFLATAVLTLFLLVHGQRLIERGLAQIADEARREKVRVVLAGAYGRAVRYLSLTVVRATAAGVFAAFLCKAVGLRGATLLGISMAVFSLVPLVGVIVGGIPIVLLAAAFHPDRLALTIGMLILYQVAEIVLVQRRIERRSVQVGPVLTLVAGMVGLELYGFGGALVAIVLVVLVASVLVELVPSDETDLFRAADEVLGGDEPGAEAA